jgi:predicted GNAT family N-acyltransferase
MPLSKQKQSKLNTDPFLTLKPINFRVKDKTTSYSVTLSITHWDQHQTDLQNIRQQVFIEEQHVPIELEWDDFDQHAIHILATINNHPIGTARLLINHDQAQLGRMAVLPPWRSLGIGQQILILCLKYCQILTIKKVTLNAQVYIIPFYQQQGFILFGDPFLEADIAHQKMIRIFPYSTKIKQVNP